MAVTRAIPAHLLLGDSRPNFAKMSRYEQDMILGKRETPSVDMELFDEDRYLVIMNRLYQLIKAEHPAFEERIEPMDLFQCFVVEPQQFPERVRAQSGAFLVSAFHERFEREEVLSETKDIPMYGYYTFAVPAANSNKVNIMHDLQLLNITEETLMPGLDSSASAVEDYYQRQPMPTKPPD